MRWRWTDLTALIGMLTCSTALADDFSDFRIPAHRLMSWDAQMSLDGLRFSGSTFTETGRQRSLTGSASSSFGWVSDSDPAQTRFSLFGAAAGNGNWTSSNDGAGSVVSSEASAETRRVSETGLVSLDHRRYPWAAPVGFSVAARAAGSYDQTWSMANNTFRNLFSGSEIVTIDATSSQDWGYRTSLVADVGVGYGRVRDATAIYEAQILERRLRETGALTRDLSPGARRKLATLLFLRSDYDRVRERPAKRLWRRVADILEEDGALRQGGLDPYSVLRAGEPDGQGGLTRDGFARSPITRWRGAFVQGIFTNSHSRTLERLDVEERVQNFLDDSLTSDFRYENHPRLDRTFDDVFAGIEGELHRPLGPPWQLDLLAQIVVPTRAAPNGFRLQTSGSLAWLLTDRWVVSAFVSQLRSLLKDDPDPFRRQDLWGWDYGASAAWYLEDRLQARILVQESQGHSEVQDSAFRSARVSAALTYRILGAFEAADWGARETLSSPR